ncbi:hypothetical protein DFH08DRAFT_432218 [Mycena albidolilacea]|uniref:DUF6534 domain-containing protein n=1 Tax=Mycena albidolilacea TaxID=1033008 RepID=A0AAD7EED6_9AGAR|nr:hypothetical protein DFH08DRAFT_432218 [Mycena albidolilacea]
MGQYDDLLGSILISSWLSAILYGMVVCKTWEYLRWNPPSEDSRARKALLLCCTVSSSIAMVAQLANVYYPTVTFWGNTVAIQTQYWPVPVYVMGNSLTGAMVETFLIYRVYQLTKSLWITLFLAVWVVIGLVGAVMVSVIIAMASEIASRHEAATAALIWTVGTAVGDILIAVALIWKLITMRTSYKSTNSLIHRLIIGAIQTGSTTSTVAVATMVAYYIRKDSSNVPTAFHYLIGPLYMLTLLYNFNLRRYRAGLSRSGSRRSETRLTALDAMGMDGIHVHRTAVVSIDSPATNAPRSTVDTAKVSPDTRGVTFSAKRGSTDLQDGDNSSR